MKAVVFNSVGNTRPGEEKTDPARKTAEEIDKAEEADKRLDEALEESFPASDPPSPAAPKR